MYNASQIKIPSDSDSKTGKVLPSIAVDNDKFVMSALAVTSINQRGNTEFFTLDQETKIELVKKLNNEVVTNQNSQSLCVLTNHNRVLSWVEELSDGSGYGIQARIETEQGEIVKNNFQINSYTKLNQDNLVMSKLDDGFIVVWQSLGQDTNKLNNGIYAQIFDSVGNKVSVEFRVNDYVMENQEKPAVSVNKDNNVLIVWHSYGQDGSGRGVYAKLYDKNGNNLTNEFRVNDYTQKNQEYPSITSLNNGYFVCVWQSERLSDNNHDIYLQLISGSGQRIGKALMVNYATDDDQKYPHPFSIDATNTIGVVWQSSSISGNVLNTNIVLKAYSVDDQQNINILLEDTRLSGSGGLDLSTAFISIEQPVSMALNGSLLILGRYLDMFKSNYGIVGWLLQGNGFAGGIMMDASLEAPDVVTTVTAQQSTITTPVPTDAINNVQQQFVQTIAENATTSTTTPILTLPTTTTDSIQAATTRTPSMIVISELQNATNMTTSLMPIVQPSITNEIASTQAVTTIAPVATLTSELQNITNTTTVTQITNEATSVNNTVIPISVTNITLSTEAQNINNTITNQTIFVGNFSHIQVINSTSIVVNGTAGVVTEYVFSDYVKYALVYSGGGSDVFTFSVSSDSLIKIENFGDTAILNLTAVGNYSSISDLNITVGSTHIHLPYNQTIIIANKYPNELSNSNFLFSIQTNITTPVIEEANANDNIKKVKEGKEEGNSWLTPTSIALGILATISFCGLIGYCFYSYYKNKKKDVRAPEFTSNEPLSIPAKDIKSSPTNTDLSSSEHSSALHASTHKNIDPLQVVQAYSSDINSSGDSQYISAATASRSESPMLQVSQNIEVAREVDRLPEWKTDSAVEHVELEVLSSKSTSNLREVVAGLEYPRPRGSDQFDLSGSQVQTEDNV